MNSIFTQETSAIRHKNKPLIVDIIGVPGCGKSTAIRHLETILKKTTIRYSDSETVNNWRKEKIIGKKIGFRSLIGKKISWRLPVIFFRSPVETYYLMKYFFSVHPISKQRLDHAKYVLKSQAFVKSLEKNNYDVIFTDEIGFNMLFTLSIGGNKQNLSMLIKTAEVFQKQSPRLVFYIEVTPEIALDRIRARAGMVRGFPMHPFHDEIFENMSEDDSIQISCERVEVIESIFSGIANVSDNAIKISGQLSPEQIASIMERNIEKYLRLGARLNF
ncbi:MAG: hypothetical protein JJU48_02875 [Methylophaga sp.]|nr:hypothetical protein [Methylophaga sp.]